MRNMFPVTIQRSIAFYRLLEKMWKNKKIFLNTSKFNLRSETTRRTVRAFGNAVSWPKPAAVVTESLLEKMY